MTFAIYAFGGVEFVAVSSGEARSPHEIAKAMRITFAMLTILYLGAIAVLVGVMAWNQAGVERKPVRHRVSFGQHPGRQPPHEFRGADGSAVGRECRALCLLAHAVFDGAQRMGARAASGN